MLRHNVTDNPTLSHFPCKRLAQSTWISQLSVIILPLKVDKVLTDRIFQMYLAQSEDIGSISSVNLPINQTSAQLNFLPHTPHLQSTAARCSPGGSLWDWLVLDTVIVAQSQFSCTHTNSLI